MKFRKCLPLLICILIFSNTQAKKKQKTINIDDHPIPISFSVGTLLGGGRGFSAVYSGFEADDGTLAVFYPGGGLFAGFDSYVTYENFISLGLAYKYQVGALNLYYENAEDNNIKNVITPLLKIKPFDVKKGQVFLGLGIEMILTNNFEITAEHTNYIEKAKYDFKKSNGPVVTFEYQENLNRWLGGKFGIKYGYLKYEMINYSVMQEPLSLKSADMPQDLFKHSSGFLEFYFGFYIQKK